MKTTAAERLAADSLRLVAAAKNIAFALRGAIVLVVILGAGLAVLALPVYVAAGLIAGWGAPFWLTIGLCGSLGVAELYAVALIPEYLDRRAEEGGRAAIPGSRGPRGRARRSIDDRTLLAPPPSRGRGVRGADFA
jgi:hypothetical protein